MALTKLERRTRIKMRIRKRVFGTAETPRLSVFRSNKEFYAQIINDETGATIVAAASTADKAMSSVPKVEQAAMLGKKLAEVATAAGIVNVVFDRNGFLYHGRVKSFADAAREAGLKF